MGRNLVISALESTCMVEFKDGRSSVSKRNSN